MKRKQGWNVRSEIKQKEWKREKRKHGEKSKEGRPLAKKETGKKNTDRKITSRRSRRNRESRKQMWRILHVGAAISSIVSLFALSDLGADFFLGALVFFVLLSLHFVLRLDEVAGRRHHEIRRRVKVGRRVRARGETRLRVKAKRPDAGRVIHREVGSAAVGAQAAMGMVGGQMGARIDGGE
jgi:hypothetical protein